jgi:predicted ferric reductase
MSQVEVHQVHGRVQPRGRASRTGTRAAVAWIVGYLGLVAFPLVVLILLPRPPGLGFWWDLSMGLGFGGLTVMGAQFGLTARFKRASAPFGIDILYYFHRWVAVGGLGLVLAHFAVLRVSAAEALRPVLPPAAPWHMTAGRIALLLLIALVASSLWRKPLRLEYDRWRIGHAVMAVAAVVFAVLHVVGTGYYSGTPAKIGTWTGYMAAWVALVVYVRVAKPWRLLRQPFRVRSVQAERGRAWTLALEPDGHPGLRFRPGQFAWLSLGSSPFAAREHPFSFASSAEERGRVEFTIKELGDFTSTVGNTPLDTVAYVDGPFGVFTPDLHPEAPGFVLIAGGIGIAPMMSMLRTFADRAEQRPLTLIYANDRFEEAVFLEELEALHERLDLRIVHVIREPEPGWCGEVGLVTGDVLERALPERADLYTFFLCGPEAMTDAVLGDLRRLGVPLRQIHFELFDMV